MSVSPDIIYKITFKSSILFKVYHSWSWFFLVSCQETSLLPHKPYTSITWGRSSTNKGISISGG